MKISNDFTFYYHLQTVLEFKAHTASPSKLNAGSPSIMKKRGYEQANGVDGRHEIYFEIKQFKCFI